MRKILIIEDDKLIAELERDYLEVSGFKTEIAFNGEDGLNFALNREFDLILLDLMLPSKDGFQLCKEIRSNKEIPILMVTAKKDSVDKIKGFNLGADDYIVKPFDPSELVARVNAHLSRYDRLTSIGKKDNIDNGVMVFKRLKILKRERRVYVADKEVKLANKEFELLLFLATNPNIVFSKTILLDRIWGMDSFADVATVTVHINRIRDKIEEDSSNPQFIETVWGAGYRFKL
ncbi:response regulator transcription factor [Clostridium beijerinckii]|uniref:Stage 0 sporulation protein A homolog n=1 Tax=Clostridium beijerinckii TaxID=1520 RepID=A0A0B5QLK7_CLOBE|nr:response regulator transcription factor [Clostridium beijerinckii]AJG99111.1 two-component system response regulator [Clostridium beijerinckii]AQS05665.1 transcriptional regulatory protein SrrA [Clostridium beijerinckii]MBA2885288.1 DNA-binding response OmpR family regulator [Clostridium beijerinckii]MBA2900211.1 DNA-binding response OmpR family regulator [Clostridium beijerinckii]MBA2909840.1 DNA-binding response OmpR family regulator [Clostridium beijerinckii]